MAAALLRRVLPSPSPSPTLPAASVRLLLSAFITSQQNAATTTVDLSSDENRRHLLNRLVYRSKQWGFLEPDLGGAARLLNGRGQNPRPPASARPLPSTADDFWLLTIMLQGSLL
ncbi:unnamed protein product [Urochloa humidicola]